LLKGEAMDEERLLQLWLEGDEDAAQELLVLARRRGAEDWIRELELGSTSPWPGFLPAGRNLQGYEEWKHVKTGMRFVELPPYSYQAPEDTTPAMSLDGDEARTKHTGRHFLLAKTPMPRLVALRGLRELGYRGHVNEYSKTSDGPGCAFRLGPRMASYLCMWAGLAIPTVAQWEQAGYGPRAGVPWYWKPGEELSGLEGVDQLSYWTPDGSLADKFDEYTTPVGLVLMGAQWELCAGSMELVGNGGTILGASAQMRRRALATQGAERMGMLLRPVFPGHLEEYSEFGVEREREYLYEGRAYPPGDAPDRWYEHDRLVDPEERWRAEPSPFISELRAQDAERERVDQRLAEKYAKLL
jgi:hypothetical protein